MSSSTINKTVFFNATRDTVWSYLTEKDKIAQWFHPPRMDLSAGEAYELVQTADDGTEQMMCWGTVLEMSAPEKMVWSFTVKPLNGSLTTVIWTLEEVLCGTRLTLKHEGIEAAAGEAAMGLLMALDAGWDEHLAVFRKAFA